MKIKLIAYTKDPEKVCGTAALVSTQEGSYSDLYEKTEGEKAIKILKKVIEYGHESVVEHASFTFSIEGISRACSHQLVRHRIASYTQQSQRYVKFDELEYVTPPEIEKDPAKKEKYDAAIKKAADSYKELIDSGIAPEDARYVYPNAAHTNIVITMNARALLHFFQLRCCNRAQWEIHEMADLMLKEIKKVAPNIFENAGPGCLNGPCPEGSKTCGKMEEVRNKYKEF
ncbi:MAG: FAD-dependent thymidylate synthase [archaeon]